MTRTGTSLARLGLTEPWAEATATELGWWSGDKPAHDAAPIMWALARSPDPDLALRSAERLLHVVPDRVELDAALRSDQVLRGRLLALLGSSTALADHLVTHPDRWHRLTTDAPQPGEGARAALLRAVGAGPERRVEQRGHAAEPATGRNRGACGHARSTPAGGATGVPRVRRSRIGPASPRTRRATTRGRSAGVWARTT